MTIGNLTSKEIEEWVDEGMLFFECFGSGGVIILFV
jgi:hypothetical protein